MTDAGGDGALTDSAELLFRQVHPDWVQDDEPTSQAFKPTPKDLYKLSVSRSSLTSAAEAFELYTGRLRLLSAGTWAVSLEEVEAGPVSLTAYSDPVTEPVPDPAHAYVDFAGRARKELETKAKLLRSAARARGRLHPLLPS